MSCCGKWYHIALLSNEQTMKPWTSTQLIEQIAFCLLVQHPWLDNWVHPLSVALRTFFPSTCEGFFVKKSSRCNTSSHLHICWSTSSHLHICWSTSSHLQIYIFTPSHLLIYIFTPSHLQIYIFTPSHLQVYMLTPSHLQISSRSSIYLSLKAGAVPPERHETQPFRTKWTLDVKNWCKMAILVSPSQPFRTKWTLDVKNWSKMAILVSPSQPFRTKWTLDVKNWCQIAILVSPSQPFRTKWTLDVKNFEVSRATITREMEVRCQKLM